MTSPDSPGTAPAAAAAVPDATPAATAAVTEATAVETASTAVVADASTVVAASSTTVVAASTTTVVPEATAIPGRLKVGSDGKVSGPASISYNNPFPCPNGNYGSGAMNGVVMHTMVGNLPGTITVFNEPSYQASAHFGIDQQGHIHQFGPIGKGWIAWAQVAGNLAWYSIEHADNGNTENPLTPAQITASAQLVEMLSAFAGFPLQVTDSVDGKGYGAHVMGGAAWGGHTCPGPGPRAGERQAIIDLAKKIRVGPPPPPPPPPGWQAEALAKAEAIQAELAALVTLLKANQ